MKTCPWKRLESVIHSLGASRSEVVANQGEMVDKKHVDAVTIVREQLEAIKTWSSTDQHSPQQLIGRIPRRG